MIPSRARYILAGAILTGLVVLSCAKRGLVSETYPAEFYRVDKKLEIGPHEKNPRFLAYGDTQSGLRVVEKFAKKEVWWTPKAFIFPFYYLYNVGQGAVGGFDYLRHVPDYGGEERRLVRDAVFAVVMETKPDFLMDLGDICMYDGRRPSHWETFLQENRWDVPLLDEVAFVPVIGNHDRANDEEYGYPNYRAIFDYPRFYVVDFPDVALFVLDSDFILDQYGDVDDDDQDRLFERWFVSADGSDEPSWLEKELSKRKQKFKIVAMHHPLVSVGKHHFDWTNPKYGRNLPAKRQRLLDLLFDHGVQLLLAGHEHQYQHNTIERDGAGETRGRTGGAGDGRLGGGSGRVIHMLITSGGGAPIRSLPGEEEISKRLESYRHEGFIVKNVARYLVHNYSIIETGEDRLVIRTVGVDRELARPYPVLETVTIETN
jgi:hypothetical protein